MLQRLLEILVLKILLILKILLKTRLLKISMLLKSGWRLKLLFLLIIILKILLVAPNSFECNSILLQYWAHIYRVISLQANPTLFLCSYFFFSQEQNSFRQFRYLSFQMNSADFLNTPWLIWIPLFFIPRMFRLDRQHFD